ncbi:MAG: nuclear transport factor 2 family protein [Acidimicrobiales bacterium]
MSETTTDVTATVDAYLAGLTETDPARRMELIQQAWTEDARFVDPLFDVEGHEALAELTAGVVAQYPGHTFRRTSAVDMHHDLVRYGFEFVAPDGTVVVTGLDVATVAADGRLQAIAGFFGDLPAEAAA